jgi:hypothetical protein
LVNLAWFQSGDSWRAPTEADAPVITGVHAHTIHMSSRALATAV